MRQSETMQRITERCYATGKRRPISHEAWRVVFSVWFCVLLTSQMVIAGNHFMPVEATGTPYHVVITSFRVNNAMPPAGTEIGLFDDTLCVGAVVLAVPDSQNIDIVAWQGNPTYNIKGFINGHPILMKIWTKESGVWKEFPVKPLYSVGVGTFGAGAYSAASIALNVAGVQLQGEFFAPEGFHLYGAYPNPFNGSVKIVYDASEGILLTAIITSITGQEILRISLIGSGETKRKEFIWNATANNGAAVASGVYILSLLGKYSIVSTKLLLLM